MDPIRHFDLTARAKVRAESMDRARHTAITAAWWVAAAALGVVVVWLSMVTL